MKAYNVLFLLLTLTLYLPSCSHIPDETMDGRGTFYCKVNGEDYFPDCQSFACQDVRAVYSTFGDALNIGAIQDNGTEPLDIRLFIYNVNSTPGIINTNDPDRYLCNTFISQGCGQLFLSKEQDFDLIVTHVDFDSQIISGTFSGNFYHIKANYTCTVDTIKLTDGIFDLPITF